MSEFKMRHNRIAVLTSGGDCAGLNAAIRAIVYRANHEYGWSVIGIRDGTAGLLERPIRYKELNIETLDPTLLMQGGTMLGTVNKGDPFAFPMPDGSEKDRSGEAVEGFKALNVDALIGIGGDGSLRILSRLTAQGGIPFVAVPKTIDNDVECTDYSIGFNSAVNQAVRALDALQPTAASHRRVMVLEVMGRDVGWIAVAAAIAGGADVALIPEIPFDAAKVGETLRQWFALGRNHSLVVCAEGVKLMSGDRVAHIFADGQVRYGGVGAAIADLISKETGAEARVTVLGHVQRGGSPTALDRIMASALGAHAVDLLANGKTNRVAVWQNGEPSDVPLEDVAGKTRALSPNHPLVRTARQLGICFGD
ncbi:MAG: ATP-dependent 6-phosphofructokinase [Rhodospirillales bacterium]